MIELSSKALSALNELVTLQRRLLLKDSSYASGEEAELFQYRLGALLVFCGGGVMRPSSVAGLVMATAVPSRDLSSIRGLGYAGALTWVMEDVTSRCLLLHVVAFKNMASYSASDRLSYVLSPILSELLLFFWRRVRPSLRPQPSNPFVFVKPSTGRWFDVNGGDRFGALCGERGLQWGTSVRVVRHVVSTAVANATQITVQERNDISAANLHTVAIVDRYYVVPDGINRDANRIKSRTSGDFSRGLGKSTLPFIVNTLDCSDLFISIS